MRQSRIEAICDAAADIRTFRLDLIAELRRRVPFTWYAWLLTDPQSAVGCSPLADVPCLPELPALIRWKYQTTVNRWTDMSGPVALLSTAGDPGHSLVWRQVQSRFGVVDVASVVFADQFGIWGFLDLWRDASAGTFDQTDVDRLTEISGPVTRAIRRCLAATFGPGDSGSEGGPVVLLLSPDLTVQAQTPETDRYLRLLVPSDGSRSPVPAGAYNVAAQLLALEAGVSENLPQARVHLAGRNWLALRAARMGDQLSTAPEGIAVTIEACPPTDRADLYGRVHGLTPRESHVLQRLVAGDNTRTAARTLKVSEYTVQDHLKAIFAKTRTHDRRTLLANALGT